MRVWFWAPLLMVGLAGVACAQNASSFTSLDLNARRTTNNAPIILERHLQPNEVGGLYGNSAFAHGYRHGYDEGFHFADLDIQMGREGSATIPKEYRDGARHFKNFFGSKKLFEQGFQTGFRRGYGDGISGGEYQIHRHVQSIAAGLSPDVLPASRRNYFDDGFASGYATAQKNAPSSRGLRVDYVEQYCRSTSNQPYALDYCSGFSRGYLLGAFDVSPSSPVESASSKNAR
ncbi:MAG: hypothetical protein JOZ10_04345 [Acidobacteria bacterium]|nr:hypothetical protein [Acidobacteriota bacterium]MBV9436521.1 hypothetical protein [Acidobacteriota bacterium]